MNQLHVADEESDRKGPDVGLMTASVVLALLMEGPCGIESGLNYGMLSDSSIYLIVLARLICLSIIALPAALYVKRYGVGALKFARERVAIVLLVTSVFLAHNVFVLGGKALGR